MPMLMEIRASSLHPISQEDMRVHGGNLSKYVRKHPLGQEDPQIFGPPHVNEYKVLSTLCYLSTKK